jgi:hypothetical protein
MPGIVIVKEGDPGAWEEVAGFSRSLPRPGPHPEARPADSIAFVFSRILGDIFPRS